MTDLQLTTAGESHGPAVTAIVQGMPSGLPVSRAFIDAQLARRQSGYGRSARQAIELDTIAVTGGLRHGVTLGSPIALSIDNRDHVNWDAAMSPWPHDGVQGNWRDRPTHLPRPGHADLAGIARGAFDAEGLRPVLERASARETAARVAGGAFAQLLLAQLGIRIRGVVRGVGDVLDEAPLPDEHDDAWARLDQSQLRCLEPGSEERMVAAIDAARDDRDTVGGVVEVVAWGVPPGIGGYATSGERLDGRLAGAVMAVHAIKAVAFGDGMHAGSLRGSRAHDELRPASREHGDQGMGVTRHTNHAGGIEGGMANGAPIVLRATMKPLPTLMRPLASVDLSTGEPATAHAERSDTCAIAAAAVALEAAVAFEIARVIRQQFGSQALVDVLDAFDRYRSRVRYPRRDAFALA